MKKEGKKRKVLSTAGELTLLVAIIAVGGLVLPIHIAPYMADLFSLTTPYEAQRQTMSVRIDNRNASHRETVTIGVSDPASSVRMKFLSYSCDYPEITLAYMQGDSLREIPCDTQLQLPRSTQHRIMPLTSKEEITYLPITITLEDDDVSGELSTIIAVAASGADEKSSLSDESTATLRSFLD
ncbi:MAG: hypothetical protein WD335_03020 [Candidatus Paceibacterota bacterium]